MKMPVKGEDSKETVENSKGYHWRIARRQWQRLGGTGQQDCSENSNSKETGFLPDPPLSDEARALGVVIWR